MIVLKILAVPFVVALTLLALVLFIGSQTLGGVVFLVLAFDVSNQKLNLQTGSSDSNGFRSIGKVNSSSSRS